MECLFSWTSSSQGTRSYQVLYKIYIYVHDNLYIFINENRILDVSGSPHGSGTWTSSENSLLRISDSQEQSSDSHHWTLYNEANDMAKEINHICASTHWKILQNCRAYSFAEFFATYHWLVVPILWVHFKTPWRFSNHPRVYHLYRLKEGECALRFAKDIFGCFTALGNQMNTSALWGTCNYFLYRLLN